MTYAEGPRLKRYRTILVTLAVVLTGVFGIVGHAGAQESNAAALDLKDLKGIDTAYQRTYSVDLQAMMATPAAKPGEMNGLFAINALVIKFDNGNDATDALDSLAGKIEQVMSKGAANVKLEKEELTGVGDKAYGYAGSVSQEGMNGSVYMTLARKDKYIHLVIGIALGNANPKDDVVAFTKTMVDAKEGTEAITANEQGFRTGGMYDKLPLTNVPGNLKPDKGAEVYPKDESGASNAVSTPSVAPSTPAS